MPDEGSLLTEQSDVPARPRTIALDSRPPNSLGVPSPSASVSSPNAQRTSQVGLHGRYIGPASGVSFLQRVHAKIQASAFSAPDDIFTFGDAPFEQSDPDLFSCIMLPRHVAQQLIDRYFDFAMPTYRFLHRPTIQAWFAELYDTFGAMHDGNRSPAKIALILLVLAHGRVYVPDAEKPGPADLSHRLYLAAEQQLSKESGPIRLISIQARLMQCYYLLTQSHINRCWRAFGTVSHLALATGLNRSRKASSVAGSSEVEIECRRRTFWCAYALDVHLSVVLGRPQLFHDEDIDTELPACIDDEDITDGSFVTTNALSGPPIMLAPIAHINLARIVKSILRHLYPLKPIPAGTRSTLTMQISDQLSEWRSSLAAFLDTEDFNASMFVPIVQRQRNVLNLTYWHAVILIHRHFLLNSFKGSWQTSISAEDADEGGIDTSVRQCLSAAMDTVHTINQMTQSRQLSRAFWIAAYFAFNASIVLYIYVIQKRSSDPSTYAAYLSAATQCQSHISSIADKGSLPERYLLLLEELRLEAIRQTDRGRKVDAPRVTSAPDAPTRVTSASSNTDVTTRLGYHEPHSGGGVGDEAFASATLGDDFSDYADWDYFASMVSSGLGNLDAFLDEDPFGSMSEFPL